MPIPLSPKPVMIGLGLIALAGAGWAVARDEGAGSSQTTDDAYVGADFSTVAPKVSGTVAQVLVADNQSVRQGQLLAVIDDRDYRVALQASEADLASAQAKAEELRRELARQSSLIAQAGANVEADLAAISLSQANAGRYQDLASDGSGSRQEQQEASARLAADQAARRRDSAGHDAARSQLPVLQARLADAEAAVARARAAMEAAKLNLSYTQVRAPVDGVIGQRGVRVGNYVQVGAPLLAVVPVAQAYVEAHFRETQLARIRPGQAASVAVDAVPGLVLKGHVESIAPATGVSFAAVAPENATGNFTKITQRLAVRIVIDPGQTGANRLHVGMSVIPTVQTAS
ncbi:HlyD family secretion protein [Novosphingobium terrae]|uniref:HlyD family secretion protein n=1 Tax=Novosphingobium terrae TaxID=2726189 RepID=UPI0019814ABF